MGSFEVVKDQTWGSEFVSSGPWQAGTQMRGHREICWCGTGSGSISAFALMGGTFGGYTTGSFLSLLGASWAHLCLPSLLQSMEATLKWGQSQETQGRKGLRFYLPVNTTFKNRAHPCSTLTKYQALFYIIYMTNSSLPQPQFYEVITVIIPISQMRKLRCRAIK